MKTSANAKSSTSNLALGRALVLIDAQKGGTGKSVVARGLADHLVHSGYSVIGFDGDAANPHLHRYCSTMMPVERVRLREQSQRSIEEPGWPIIGNAVGKSPPGTTLLVDLPAGILNELESHMPQLRRLCAAYQCSLTRVWVMDTQDDSVRILKRTQNLFPAQDTVIVRNGKDGPWDAFQIWENSTLRANLVGDPKKPKDGSKASETYLHYLPERVRDMVRDAGCSFRDALSLDLAPFDRIELEIWLEQLEKTFQPIVDRLGVRP